MLLLLAACTKAPEPTPPPAPAAVEAPAPAATVVPNPPVPQLTAAADAPCPDCNVVWITMDTTRADRMGFLGNKSKLTPNLDKMAKKGTAWAYAYSQAPETSLSVSSYMSGRYRHNAGMDFYISEGTRVHPLSPAVTTIAEVLKAQGYRVTGFNSNPLIGPGFKMELNQGFDAWNALGDHLMAKNGTRVWGEAEKKDKKLFLYLHYHGPHTPNAKLDGFEARRGKFDTQLTEINAKLHTDVDYNHKQLSDGDIAYIRANYDDAVWQMDAQIGELLDTILASPRAQKTIFVITADHGESLLDAGDPPWLGHEHQLTEPMVHVPLLIVAPGVKPGVIEKTRIAENVDIAPTVAGLLGLPIDPSWGWDGESLVGPDPKLAAISERGVWDKREVSARTPFAVLLTSPPLGWVKRFDHKADPDWKTNVEAGGPPWSELEARLKLYLDNLHPPQNPDVVEQEANTQAKLRELGYVQ